MSTAALDRLDAACRGQCDNDCELWWDNVRGLVAYRDGETRGVLRFVGWSRLEEHDKAPYPFVHFWSFFDRAGRYTGPRADGIYPTFEVREH